MDEEHRRKALRCHRRVSFGMILKKRKEKGREGMTHNHSCLLQPCRKWLAFRAQGTSPPSFPNSHSATVSFSSLSVTYDVNLRYGSRCLLKVRPGPSLAVCWPQKDSHSRLSHRPTCCFAMRLFAGNEWIGFGRLACMLMPTRRCQRS